MSGEQLLELSKLCELLALEQSDTPEVHAAEAAKLARELFPVMAKPLVWEGNEFGELVSGEYSVDSCGPLLHWARLRGMNLSKFKAIDEARAACEQHHQQTFKDNLA